MYDPDKPLLLKLLLNERIFKLFTFFLLTITLQ